MIYVATIEDDDDIREGLALLIDSSEGYRCAGAYRDCETALKDIQDNPADIILMDIELPGISGIDGIRRVKQLIPQTDIIMLTAHYDDEMIFDALCAGASGYLIKTTPPKKLIDSIREVHEGGAAMSASIALKVIQSFQKTPLETLTQRESEVLAQMCKGKSYKMIADHLHVGIETVHSHIKNIYKKLEVNSKSEAVAKALQEKLV